MKRFTYSCPYCETWVEVEPDRAGKTFVCPSADCGRSFRLEIPTAKIISERGDRDALQASTKEPSAQRVGGGTPTHHEETLTKLHPAMFRKHPFRFLLYLLFAAVGFLGAGWRWSTSGELLGSVAYAALGLVAVSLLGWWWLETTCSTLIVTSKRTIHRTGLLSRSTSEVRHNDVRNLRIDQSVLDRLLGVGDIAISSAGQAGLEIVVEAVPHPDEVIQIIRERQR